MKKIRYYSILSFLLGCSSIYLTIGVILQLIPAIPSIILGRKVMTYFRENDIPKKNILYILSVTGIVLSWFAISCIIIFPILASYYNIMPIPGY